MFVIFNPTTTTEQASYKRFKSYAAAAKRAAKLSTDRYQYVAMDEEFYNLYVVHTVTRVNRVHGVTFTELSNTPFYLSPSSETYHSR